MVARQRRGPKAAGRLGNGRIGAARCRIRLREELGGALAPVTRSGGKLHGGHGGAAAEGEGG